MSPGNHEPASLRMSQQDILYMLKHGRSDELRLTFEQMQRANYPNEFVPFMETMIRENKLSSKSIALRSGLYQDTLYKLLRGDKHTDERDYILAICLAIGMTLPQTQHALISYGMPALDDRDIRSHIILLAIRNGDGIDELDRMLENAGYPLLKTSPDMPSAPINIILSPEDRPAGQAVPSLSAGHASSLSDADPAPPPSAGQAASLPFGHADPSLPAPRGRRVFTELDAGTDAAHNGGNAAFDYDYYGWMDVEDQAGQRYHVEALFGQETSRFVVCTREQVEKLTSLIHERYGDDANAFDAYKAQLQREDAFCDAHYMELLDENGEPDFDAHPELLEEMEALFDANPFPDFEPLEVYSSLEEASASEFFPFFLKLDKSTDKKVQEVMNRLDDTREFGYRVGSSWQGGEEPKIYIEMFNHTQPELREYFQIVEFADGTCRYTASHESCFMQIELGRDLYECYFGSLRRPPEYYIDTDRNEFTGSEVRYRFIFSMMQTLLHEQALKTGGFVKPDPAKVTEEKIEALIEQGVMMMHQDNPKAALSFFRQAMQLQEAQDLNQPVPLFSYICTCFKLALTLENLEDPEAEQWYQRIIDRKEQLLARASGDSEEYRAAAGVLANTLLRQLRRVYHEGSESAAAVLGQARELLELVERHHAAEEDWPLQLEARSYYARLLEDVDPEESLRQYRLSVNLARDHHLDQHPRCAFSVAVQYNNYAWVLWNKCGREDAALYYGRAIDLLESYLVSGIVDRETVLPFLKHVGEALTRLYLDTGRAREAEALKSRLEESGILPE